MPKPNIEYSKSNLAELIKNRAWTNKDNIHFYEDMPESLYTDLLRNSGIDNYQDIEQIKSYILNAKSIFELGLCRGRVIQGCRKIGYQNRFSGIEIVPSLYQELKDLFSLEATLFEGDFLQFTPPEKYDLALLMGSTLYSFSLNEQKKCFAKLQKLLTSDGRLIVDVSDGAFLKKNIGEPYSIRANGKYHAGYLSSIKEINNMAQDAHFKLESERHYVGSSEVNRISLVYCFP